MSEVETAQGSANTVYCPTVIEFILDETGSMSSWHGATVSGFNTFVTEQRAQDGQCLLTLTKFDTSGTKTPYADIDVQVVPLMNMNMFCPGGGTNLRDTVIDLVEALKYRLSEWTIKPNVLVVVLTDGEDNASNRSPKDVADLLHSREDDGWTFVYLGATANALNIARQLGFKPGNSKMFEGSRMAETMSTLAQATTAYRATRASASVASAADDDFFSTAR